MTIILQLFALLTLLSFVAGALVLGAKKAPKYRTIALLAAIILGTLYLLLRWIYAGRLELSLAISQNRLAPGFWPWLKVALSHPPFTNLFEVLISLSWALLISALIIEKRYKINLFAPLACAAAMLAQGAAFWALDSAIDPLAPVLRSWWLHLHVAVAAFSYAAAIGAAVSSFLYLLKDGIARKWLYLSAILLSACGVLAFAFGQKPWNIIFLISALIVSAIIACALIFYNKIGNLNVSLTALHTLTSRLVALTFITLTLVLVTGSVWAHYSWGRFWSWDPKETWTLIAWLSYAAYLFLKTRLSPRHLSYLAMLAILMVLFAFLGVNLGLFGAGLHVYGRG